MRVARRGGDAGMIEHRMFNQRLFIARRLNIKLSNSLPTKIDKLSKITFDGVAPGDPAATLVAYASVPPASTLAPLITTFRGFNKKSRYRGKNVYMFFLKWLSCLVIEFNDPASLFFKGVTRTGKVRQHELTLGNFASKSRTPSGLRQFIKAITY